MDSSTTINDDFNGKLPSSSEQDTTPNTSKVGTWFSDFVGDVKRKSHLKFQKWTQSVRNENCSFEDLNTNIDIDLIKDIGNSKPIVLDNSLNCKAEENFWTKLKLDHLTITETSKILQVDNIGHLGKTKISAFYEKIKCTSDKRMENDFLKESNESYSNDNIPPKSIQNLTSCSSSQNNEHNFVSITRKLGDIGRTKTVFSESVENDSASNMWRPIPKTMKHLRSFSVSEQNDSNDIYDDGIENNNPIDIKKRIDITNQIVSSSLPNFMPISPIVKNTSFKEIGIAEVPRRKSILFRDSSIQSDSSHCSSVESLLEARKPDPEAILLNLGFGPIESEDILTRIPKRFLKPSQVRGIDTEAFLRRQQLASHLHDHSVLGYRGLLGNPDIPPSTIVAKIMERFELNERNRCIIDINMNRPQSAPPTHGGIQ